MSLLRHVLVRFDLGCSLEKAFVKSCYESQLQIKF